MRILIAAIFAVCFTAVAAPGQSADVWLEESFDTLDNWKPLHFKKIEKHSQYRIAPSEDGNMLVAESNASASGLILKQSFDVYQYPWVSWRWKADNVFAEGDATQKTGDDYPIRIYIIFKYDPETASAGTRFKYGLVKRLYGEYPPDSSLNYIWANRPHDQPVIISPYTDRSRMIALQAGAANLGTWQQESIHIIDDYRRAFGEDPPLTASLAIMSDADNTGEAATAYVDYIRIHK